MANDQKKSWKTLVDAVELSKENIIAEKLAKDVGVPYPGVFIIILKLTLAHVIYRIYYIFFQCMYLLLIFIIHTEVM